MTGLLTALLTGLRTGPRLGDWVTAQHEGHDTCTHKVDDARLSCIAAGVPDGIDVIFRVSDLADQDTRNTIIDAVARVQPRD